MQSPGGDTRVGANAAPSAICAPLVDSHCHLSFDDFNGRQDELHAAMRAAGVCAALLICTRLDEFDKVHALANAQDGYWATVGVHPDTEGVTEPSVDDLVRAAARPKVVAIGETGLDYYRLGTRTVNDMAWQRERFRTHIRAALRLDLPLVIHTRSASEDTLRLLREEGQGRVRGVFHCFTETAEVAQAALAMGFHIAFSGIITFKNAQALRDVVPMVPLDRLLVETDSPYLAPVPHRGKLNQPAYVAHVADAVAQLRGCAPSEVRRATTDNFERLFNVQVPG